MRKVISKEEFVEFFDQELKKAGCTECTVGKPVLLASPDLDGLNWSRTITVRNCANLNECTVVRHVHEQAILRFNIK